MHLPTFRLQAAIVSEKSTVMEETANGQRVNIKTSDHRTLSVPYPGDLSMYSQKPKVTSDILSTMYFYAYKNI